MDLYAIVQVKEAVHDRAGFIYHPFIYKLVRNKQGDLCWDIYDFMFDATLKVWFSSREIPASEFQEYDYPYLGIVEDRNPIPFREERLWNYMP